MGGVMTDSRRDQTMARVERLAVKVIGLREHLKDAWKQGDYRAEQKICQQLAEAVGDLTWVYRDMPETERDAAVPPTLEILKTCQRYDEQKAECERLAAREAARKEPTP